ncbi:E3 ubiquitin-protein ligase-like [Brienomyrus brachyistius]|uniref:E3 ubiquitin-protein ligase-like n=1 Tax=Brienomyrus brachyistius TaxID=42636 RepID=UPI0020B1A6B0|nr:E3 ubiquitin-protein ligase-like [Brienomyrus brachyistius]
MSSELECGICYQSYNTGRRLPRELGCRHTFCESCLSAIVRQSACPAEACTIICPLCRHSTPIPASGDLRQALRVDEGLLGQTLEAGFLEDESDSDGKPEPDLFSPNPASDPAPRTRKGKMWRSLRRICGRFVTDTRHTSEHRHKYMTNEEMKDIALMSCYMI